MCYIYAADLRAPVTRQTYARTSAVAEITIKLRASRGRLTRQTYAPINVTAEANRKLRAKNNVPETICGINAADLRAPVTRPRDAGN